MGDVYTDALNAPPGRLAEVLLKKLTSESDAGELSAEMCKRLDRLVDAPGKAGKLARVRLAAAVSDLFERAPVWTKTKILPLFEWSSADAADAWESRKYSNYIGSPELFGLFKKPLLEMFGRGGTSLDELRNFAEWFTVILISNQYRKSDLYPLTAIEARSALRRAGVGVLSRVGNRLAIEMEAANPEQKAERWRTIVNPVFCGIWPLDVELQSHASTFELTKILRATGEVFPEATDVIIPFIRPDDPRSRTTIFSLAKAPEPLYASSPEKMFDLVAAVVGEASPGSVIALGEALSRIRVLEPRLADTRKFQKLLSFAAP
jgi:hypothetical protein